MTFFKNIFNFRDSSVDLDVNEFSEKMKIKDIVLLDIRTPAEFGDVRIDGALNINYYNKDFPEKISEFDKNKLMLLYCRSGNRSYNAAVMMKKMGFANTFHLQGGIINWIKFKKPVVR